MPVAAALGDFEDIVGFQAIDHEITVEVGAENVVRDLVTAGTLTRANDIDGGQFAAEDPQPRVLAPDAPTGFVGMDDVALAEGFDEEVAGRFGQVGEALFGT